ncbi:MAG TPA: hypothetical protein VL381_04590 [Rhodocyclaceae bacterium]|nr:hypothetical protein [Rhodocyclaceae bacterium]
MRNRIRPLSRFAQLAIACTATFLASQSMAAITFQAWPTTTAVVTADTSNAFGEDLSGLFYQPASGTQTPILWAVQNSGKLYSLTWNGTVYAKRTDNSWGSGKTIVFPNGSGAPDSEGITKAEMDSPAVYVSIERDGKGSNRFSVLRYDTSQPGTKLVATNEWNLTASMPKVSDTNLGLEGVTWVPDSYLVASGFKDANTKLPYDPANYPSHGTGLFFVGLEYNGTIYAYALNQTGSSYNLIATIASGQKKIMDLSFDRDNNVLWAYCDNGCKNQSTLLNVDTTTGSATLGTFVVRKGYKPPKGISTGENNEGIAIAPESECVNGLKTFIWTDDGNTNNHALRRGTITCGPQF